MSVLSEEVVEINCEGLFILQRKVLGDSSVKRGSNIEKLPSIQVKFPPENVKSFSSLYMVP